MARATYIRRVNILLLFKQTEIKLQPMMANIIQGYRRLCGYMGLVDGSNILPNLMGGGVELRSLQVNVGNRRRCITTRIALYYNPFFSFFLQLMKSPFVDFLRSGFP